MEDKKFINIPEIVSSSLAKPWLTIIQMKILMEKYKEECIFMPIDLDVYNENVDFKIGDYELNWVDNEKLVPPIMLGLKNWMNLLRSCSTDSKRFVVMPLSMTVLIEKKNGELDKKGHLNMLIYDKTNYTLERYEPNGQQTPKRYNTVLLDQKLKQIFGIVFNNKNIILLSPLDFCPIQGPQYIETITRREYKQPITKGSCGLWSFVYADTRLSFPDKNRTDVQHLILDEIQNNSPDLYSFIIKYLTDIVNISIEILGASSKEEINNILIRSVSK